MSEVSCETSPILVEDADDGECDIVRRALEAEGFRCRTPFEGDAALWTDARSVLITHGGNAATADAWYHGATRGATVVLVNPSSELASRFGLCDFRGTRAQAFLFLPARAGLPSAAIELHGSTSLYGGAEGLVHAQLARTATDGDRFPAIVECPVGAGRIVLVLFSLARAIVYFHQRTPEVAAETPRGSAERLALAGMARDGLALPQLDRLMAYVSNLLRAELARLERPMPLLCPLPHGRLNQIAFSFDDLCPSGRPLRRAWGAWRASLRGARAGTAPMGIAAASGQLLRAAEHYPSNYMDDAARMIGLFARHGSRGSVFALPFAGPLRNHPRLTGYAAFRRGTFDALVRAGWDVGTHINPADRSDYAAVRDAYMRHFGAAPRGHRGHELGWVDWDEDWNELDALGYSYDSTWTWGGHAGLSWPLGTGLPFHPVDRAGKDLKILEVPVAAWVEDLCHAPAQGLQDVEAALERHPGFHHFGAHTWRLQDSTYAAFIGAILDLVARRDATGCEYNLAEICDFWRLREYTRVRDLAWNEEDGVLRYVLETACENRMLAMRVPRTWGRRGIRAVACNGVAVTHGLRGAADSGDAIVMHDKGTSSVDVRYE